MSSSSENPDPVTPVVGLELSLDEKDIAPIFSFEPPIKIEDNGDGTSRISFVTAPFDATEIPLPYSFPSFPSSFFAPLGAIIVQWGLFEQLHDEALASLLAAYPDGEKPNKQGFTARSKRFRKLMGTAFKNNPTLVKFGHDILEEAEHVYIGRNILSHGQLKVRISTNNPNAEPPSKENIAISIYGIGEHHRKIVDLDLDMRSLKAISNQIANLCGRISEFTNPSPSIPKLSESDKDFLKQLRNSDREFPDE